MKRKRSKAHPFGGNPYGAPSLRFDLKMPSPFEGAKDYDSALGLTKRSGGFDTDQNTFDNFDLKPKGRSRPTLSGKSRKRKFAIERQARVHSGQAPLSPEEEFNMTGDRDVFGAPHNHGGY